jgi:hypothetical protein
MPNNIDDRLEAAALVFLWIVIFVIILLPVIYGLSDFELK